VARGDESSSFADNQPADQHATGAFLADVGRGESVRRDAQSYARDVLHFDAMLPGEYRVLLECKDAAGKTPASQDSRFTKQDLAAKYEWWDTPRGSIERVISPWTPVTFRNGGFGVWGREMAVGPAGLPTRVRTQQHEILAAPARLIARAAGGGGLAATGYKME
jgi:hypothetical protein